MSEKYKNPDSLTTNNIINSIKNAETHDEVMKIIDGAFPTWIITSTKKFCRDYPHYTEIWNKLCNKIKCDPLDIILVDELITGNKDYSLIEMFAELLTLFGHQIMKKSDFFQCKICDSIIPSKELYNKLKESKIKTPPNWSMICRGC